MLDKISHNKRSVIETVNDELKNMFQVGKLRDCSVRNFFTNLISGIIAYCFSCFFYCLLHHKYLLNRNILINPTQFLNRYNLIFV